LSLPFRGNGYYLQVNPLSTDFCKIFAETRKRLPDLILSRVLQIYTCKKFTYRYNAGMIEVTVREAAQKRGVENSKQLADRMGCNPAIIWKVWTKAVTPTLPMLDRICEALGDCELSELVTREPSKKRKAAPARRDGTKKSQPQKKIKAAT
jgi:DNA-binding Xre family transcriptional regulator